MSAIECTKASARRTQKLLADIGPSRPARMINRPVSQHMETRLAARAVCAELRARFPSVDIECSHDHIGVTIHASIGDRVVHAAGYYVRWLAEDTVSDIVSDFSTDLTRRLA